MATRSNEKHRGLDHFIKAFGWSMAGFRWALGEAAFRQELLLVAVLAPLALWLGKSGVERALLCGSLLLVLIVEILNSAIEAAIDRFGGEHHPLSGQAKDMGSAAVFLALTNVVIVWLLILC
ncbi:MAG: diacylglycerol kinase [Desulfobulbaceae bacterium A2]|nr:MAG: diacylglycerol kinase [Desulfobulbaceae bacterium A2]